MSDNNLVVGSITSSYYPDDKNSISIEKIAQESQPKANVVNWYYYVVIGHLEDYQTWKQDYIVPFKDKSKAEEYRDFYLNNSSYCQVFIVEQNMILPSCLY